MLLKDFVTSQRAALSQIYPAHEAACILELLCTDYLGLRSHAWLIEPDKELEGELLSRATAAASRLLECEPVQYITGWTDFYGRRFNVSRDTLIPRPETETLCTSVITQAKRLNKSPEQLSILDLCTGSGCIAWTLACELPGAKVVGVDISEAALNMAKKQNPQRGDSVIPPQFSLCDILGDNAIEILGLNGPFDFIVSNPPYVLPSEKERMRPNVLEYEPSLALFVPEEENQLFNRKISEISQKILKTDGCVYVEINESLPQESAEVFKAAGFSDVTVIFDDFSKARFIKADKNRPLNAL